MYYKLINGEDIFELNPGLKAVPKFQNLTSMQMTYICLVCDPSHDNPIRTLQGKAKREKAAILAGYKLEDNGKRLNKNAREIIAGLNKSIEEGINEFRKLHYDEKIDTYESLTTQIGEITDFLKSRKDNDARKLKLAIELGSRLPALVEAKQKIEHLLSVNHTSAPQLGATYTAADLLPVDNEEDDGSEQPFSIIDQFMKKSER